MWHFAAAALAVVSACSVSSSGGEGAAAQEATGSLNLRLVGTDSTGTQFRLRNATFTIDGYPDYFDPGSTGGWSGYYYSKDFSSEAYLDAPSIVERVVPGYYYVNLWSSNWYLEELTPSGPVRVEKAVLLSQNYVSGYVYDGGTTNFSFRFGVGGEIIDFYSGNVKIGIEIVHPGEEGGASGAAGSGPIPPPTAGEGGAAAAF